jgi:hypothetical protein
MGKGIAAILGGLALLSTISVKPADAACASWGPPHWAPGHWNVYGAWVPPRWVPPRCVAYVAPPPPVVAPLPVVAVAPYYGRPWRRPGWCYYHPYRC